MSDAVRAHVFPEIIIPAQRSIVQRQFHENCELAHRPDCAFDRAWWKSAASMGIVLGRKL